MKKLKIQTRLLTGYLIVIAIMLVISIFVIIQLGNVRGQLNTFNNSVLEASNQIKSCSQMVQYGARNVREMVIAENDSQRKEAQQDFQSATDSIESSMKKLQATSVLSSSDEESYTSALNEWMEDGDRIVSLTNRDRTEDAVEEIWSTCRPALDNLSNMAESLEQKIDSQRDEMMADIQSRSMVLIITLIIALVVAILAAIILAVVIVRSITRPLSELNGSIQSLSEGDLHNEPQYESKDELGEIAESLRKALATLQVYIGDISVAMKMMAEGDFNIYATEAFKGEFEEIQTSIRDFSIRISQTLEQIGTASQNVAGGANQISDGAQALSQGATEQASSVEEISATVSEISSQVKDTADSANEINAQAGDVGAQIQQSNEKMQRMLAAMNEISRESGNISNIIKTIDDISRPIFSR